VGVCGRARGPRERVQNGDCGANPTFRVTVDVRGAFISEGPPRLFLLLGWLLFYETLADGYTIYYNIIIMCDDDDDDGLSAAACPRASLSWVTTPKISPRRHRYFRTRTYNLVRRW